MTGASRIVTFLLMLIIIRVISSSSARLCREQDARDNSKKKSLKSFTMFN